MIKILLDLVSEKRLASKLGFKGGTALYLFYGLDRFSTDLDFDLIGDGGEKEIELVGKIIKNNLTIVDKKTKRFTWYWMGSYEKGEHKVKVEINTRQYANEYEQRDFRGYSIKVMKPEYMMAHKLCAVIDRKNLQNRDLYDVWWMLEQDFPLNKGIVKTRMGIGMDEYWVELIKKVDELPENYDILQGLGEVMEYRKKDWVRDNLLKELRIQLASRS
ncbi:MAG: nucleotidyl transferase AbiEii/AbiGii toxin family protein [bacterium]